MKHDTIKGTYVEGDTIHVIDPNHLYNDMRGSIIRLSTAGEHVTYYHAQLLNVQTPITFRASQLERDFHDAKTVV